MLGRSNHLPLATDLLFGQPQFAVMCELDLTVLQGAQKDSGLVVLIYKALKADVALPFYLHNQSLQIAQFPCQQLHPQCN